MKRSDAMLCSISKITLEYSREILEGESVYEWWESFLYFKDTVVKILDSWNVEHDGGHLKDDGIYCINAENMPAPLKKYLIEWYKNKPYMHITVG